jgi:hypothetical protein
MRTESREIAEAAPDGGASLGVDASMLKSELYNEARNAGIEGRSAMNKEQLVEALRQRQETSSPREPATATERQPARSEVDSREVVPPAAGGRGPDRCAIAYKASGRYGEFNVIVTETDGSRRSVARSPAFRAPTFGPLRRRGQARIAHDLLVSRLEACEWWPVDSDGPWHELRFVRLRGEGMRSRRSLVTVVREAGQARFAVEELDSYGKPTPFMLSTPFGAPRVGRVRPSVQAKAALKQLVKRMESEGWKAVTCVGKDWYAISFSRPVSANWGPRAPRSRAGRRAAEPA